MKGKLIIISAPSGAGKSTIVNHLLEKGLKLEFSISATTRKPRGDEKDGKEYYFLTVEEFKKRVASDEFVEWEEVYEGMMYGTLISELERIWKNGNHVLFDVDVKGGMNLKKKFTLESISIFIMPPSVGELERRLVKRGVDTPEKIRMRVAKAREEMDFASEFDYIVINDDLEEAKAETLDLVSNFLNS